MTIPQVSRYGNDLYPHQAYTPTQFNNWNDYGDSRSTFKGAEAQPAMRPQISQDTVQNSTTENTKSEKKEEMSMKDKVFGATQLGIGGALLYKGLEHGLPRTLGIRTEYHVTSKENAKSIKKMGNFLDPKFGGKNGWAAKIKIDGYVDRSRDFVHITGVNKDSPLPKFLKKFPPYREIARQIQLKMYKVMGNMDNPAELRKCSKLDVTAKVFNALLFKNKTKTFYISGIDSYFNNNFIVDVDNVALKSAKKLKVYDSRFSAMIAGLKKFGLKGMKENKGRAFAGLTILVTTGLVAGKLIKKGIDKITNRQKQQQ